MKHKRKHHTKSKSKPHSTSKSKPHSRSKSRPHSRSTSTYSKSSSVNSKSNSVKPGGWRSLTTTEKLLIPVSFLLMISSVILLVVLIVMLTKPSKNELEICSTPGCVEVSHNFLNAMNTSVDPCTDFFEYSCGQFIEKNEGVVNIQFIITEVKHQLRALLEQNVTSESKAINMARITYQSCMNMARFEELKSRPIFESIDKLGKWPILESNWNKNSFKFTDLLVTSYHENAHPFFQVAVVADSKINSRKITTIDQGQVSTGFEIYFLDSVKYSDEMVIYREYIRLIVQLLKTDGKFAKSDDEINRDIDKMIVFETEIAKILVSIENRRDNSRMYNKRKIQDLYELMPQIDWIDYFRRIAPSGLAYLFNNETEIIVRELDYMKKLSKLLESTDAIIINNYVVWRAVHENAQCADERFQALRKEFDAVFHGQAYSARYDECIDTANMFLPMAIGALYVEAHFQEDDKRKALDMVLDLKSSFLEMLQQNDWMDRETKDEAIAKVNSMINHVGYPDEIKDFKKLDEMYKGIEVNHSDSFLKVLKTLIVWKAMQSFNELVKPSNKREAVISPSIVNALYSPPNNNLEFPAAYLQPPVFSGMFPKAVNYGSMGSTIGHEMTHGFDDQGSQYDKDGNVRNWFSESSLKAFNKKKSCFVDQYGRYAVPGTAYKINGVITQGENIADNGGLRVAFQAYQKYVKEHGEEPRLPGFKSYTNEQIFFISFSYPYCGKSQGAALINQILTDPHPPGEFRVNGAVSNMKEFADAFNCPKNSPSNPDHKCVVW